MRHGGRWTTAMLITMGLASAGCTSAASTATDDHTESPASVMAIPGKDVKKVILTAQAAQRLDIQTVTVGAAQTAPTKAPSPPPDMPATVVPYAAVLYDPNGETWVYTVPQPLSYVRQKVVVVTVGGADGTEAVLSEAPPAGTTIVTTGVMELYGAELGVGK